jgi:hypothetical protein
MRSCNFQKEIPRSHPGLYSSSNINNYQGRPLTIIVWETPDTMNSSHSLHRQNTSRPAANAGAGADQKPRDAFLNTFG